MLQDGGTAVILVPSGQSIYNSLDEELGHFLRYSEEQLRQRMTEAGFHVETVLRFNRASRPGWWLNGTILKRRTISRVQLRGTSTAWCGCCAAWTRTCLGHKRLSSESAAEYQIPRRYSNNRHLIL